MKNYTSRTLEQADEWADIIRAKPRRFMPWEQLPFGPTKRVMDALRDNHNAFSVSARLRKKHPVNGQTRNLFSYLPIGEASAGVHIPEDGCPLLPLKLEHDAGSGAAKCRAQLDRSIRAVHDKRMSERDARAIALTIQERLGGPELLPRRNGGALRISRKKEPEDDAA